MPSLVWNNFLALWLCLVLLALTIGIYIYSNKQRPNDTVWRFTVTGCAIAMLLAVFMLLYDMSIWLYVH